MARYVVEVDGEAPSKEAAEGLAVAKALAKKTSQQTSHDVVVRDTTTGKVVARFAGQKPAESPPTLASSVKRMRAANDRLREALVPPRTGRKRGG